VTTTALDTDQLVEQAVAAAGTDDFGAPTWREGLDRLVDALQHEARLHELGVAIVAGEIVAYLVNRAEITRWVAEHPEVARQEITAPVVIVGQPRTGTTILYDLLAQDPRSRAPLSWEVDRPCPPPRTETYDDDPRIAEVQATIELADTLIPGFTTYHPIGARLAQECVRILGSDFRSWIFPTQYRVPSYASWLLEGADMAPAYRWHRRFLQHLQSEHAGERWLLKSPGHIWHLDALSAEYPDAVLIQTHRDPLRVVASVSALVAHLRRMASDETSVRAAAEEFADHIVVGLDRFLAARTDGSLAGHRVIDVHYQQFAADPLGTIDRVHDELGLDLPSATRRRMASFLDSHRHEGRATYTFADTGLDADALRERVRAYEEHFDVPREPLG
jgi:hypothetical protein